MQLTQPFLQLPISFCADTLAAEVDALPASAWEPHPTGFVGNEAVRLVTPEGKPTDALTGPMAPTEQLLRCPYIMEVMAELGGVWGRSRLMGLAPGADVPTHVDVHYYWRTHLRIHIPVITNPGVRFTCDDETIHMAAGETWLFDSFRRHGVQNKWTERRVHLVLDTVGGDRLWDLIDAAQSGDATPGGTDTLLPGQRKGEALAFEQVNSPKVMSPWEIRCHIAYLAEQVVPDPSLDRVMKRLEQFTCVWAAAWARFGEGDEGLPTYREMIATLRHDLKEIGGGHIVLRNDRTLYFALSQLVVANAIAAPAAEKLVASHGQRLAS